MTVKELFYKEKSGSVHRGGNGQMNGRNGGKNKRTLLDSRMVSVIVMTPLLFIVDCCYDIIG